MGERREEGEGKGFFGWKLHRLADFTRVHVPIGGGKGLRGSRFYEHLVFFHTAIFDDAGGPDDLMNEIWTSSGHGGVRVQRHDGSNTNFALGIYLGDDRGYNFSRRREWKFRKRNRGGSIETRPREIHLLNIKCRKFRAERVPVFFENILIISLLHYKLLFFSS